jgi:DNA-binding transcriptional MocR family regulator
MADLVFGKYEVQHRLAIGGMGEVFYALQRGVAGFERPVILKSLLPELAQQEGFIDQFLDEARVAAREAELGALLHIHHEGEGEARPTRPSRVRRLAGMADKVVKLCAGAGVKLTPAGSTWPYKKDPQNSNIRLAPSFPSLAEIDEAMQVFVLCVELAALETQS